MNISINPTYFCNFKCDFCYLTPDQLRDQKKIEPKQLDKLLSNIPEPIDHIDLYGGEIGALRREYYNEIKCIEQYLHRNSIEYPNKITKQTKKRLFALRQKIETSSLNSIK